MGWKYMAMTPELQKYYEDRFDMIASQGWLDLIEQISEMEKATNDISSIQDEKTLHFKRGEISIMRWIISLKNMSEQVYEQLKAEE